MLNYCESTLRRRAYKIGYQVKKGFRHFGRYVYHDQDGTRYSGYMVRELRTGFYEWDGFNSDFDFLWTLEDVESFLKEQYKALGLAW